MPDNISVVDGISGAFGIKAEQDGFRTDFQGVFEAFKVGIITQCIHQTDDKFYLRFGAVGILSRPLPRYGTLCQPESRAIVSDYMSVS